MPLNLTAQLADAIRAHAAQDYPHECCGFLVGQSQAEAVTVARTHAGGQHAAGLAAQPL